MIFHDKSLVNAVTEKKNMIHEAWIHFRNLILSCYM